MTDVTEHSTRIQTDRMELITTSDRIPERLRRLENAASGGMLGGGGSQGTVVWALTGWTTSVAMTVGSWKLYALPSSGFLTEPAGAITRNADGSLTVKDAGWYEVQATAYFTGTGSNGILVSTTKDSESNAFTQEFQGGGAIQSIVGTVNLAANATIYPNVYASAAGNCQLRGFSIARIGGPVGPTGATGPQGAASTVPGPTGATGAQGVQGLPGEMEVYEQPTEPASTNEGAVWIDTDAVPLVSETIRTMRTGQSYVVGGSLTAGMVIPSFFVPIMGVGQTTKIIGFITKIASGTSIDVRLTRNGSNLGSGPSPVATTKGTTSYAPPIAIADGDEIGLVLSSPVGTPQNLSLTVILEHTV